MDIQFPYLDLILIAAKCLSQVLMNTKLYLEIFLYLNTDKASKENLHNFSGPHGGGIIKDQ